MPRSLSSRADLAADESIDTPRVLLVDDDEVNLMLTGLDDDASVKRAYEAGATDFFVKSTQWSLLEMRLRHLLRAARTLHELERSQRDLTRAQVLARMSDAQGQVFVTFSAGVTGYRPAERIEDSLERADQALYEAKRTGKNRTCIG